jgi:hypothetical protein
MMSALGSNRVCSDPSDLEFITPMTVGGLYPDGTSSSNEGYYIVITGAAPSTTIATLRYASTAEYIPN